MTFARGAAITVGILGAFGLGVLASPHLRSDMDSRAPMARVESAPDHAESPATRTREGVSRDRTMASPESGPETMAPMKTTLVASDEEVRDRAKGLLTWGTDTRKAADGFNSAEQFMTVAHAANNTEVPFVLLKHRVLNENKSLATAIRESKPELDSRLEADRARLDARADLAKLSVS